MAVFGVFAVLAFGFLTPFGATRYKRCASDEILVVYGRVGGGKASRVYPWWCRQWFGH